MTKTKIQTRLVALMKEERPAAAVAYEPEDVFDVLGLVTDLRGVNGLTDKQFEEVAMERLEMTTFFCADCGETLGGSIEMCPAHLTEAVEGLKSWGA